MSYVEKVLQPDETVRYRSTVHWVIYLPAMFFASLGGAACIFLLVRGHENAPDSTLTTLCYGLTAIGLGLAALSFVNAWFTRWTTEIAVTDRRVIYKVGVVRRRTIEMNMDKVESVDVDQSILGRILDYGNILVRGTGAGLEPLRTIASPLEFRNALIAR